jgi:hypothetical protein
MIMTSLCEIFDIKHEIISTELASEDDIREGDDSAIKKSDGMITVKEEDKDIYVNDKYVGTFMELTGNIKEEKFEIFEVIGANDEARDYTDGIKDEVGEISEDGMTEPGRDLATCDQVSSNEMKTEVTEGGITDDESSSTFLTDKPAGILELIAKLEDITDNM